MRELLLGMIVAIAACSSSPRPVERAGAGADTGGATVRAAATGPLSEAEFKALHQLRTDAPPALRGEMIDLAGGQAYLSLPAGATAPVPGLVVIHEWWGLNDHVKHWTDRLASAGYAAIAVDLYRGTVATDPDTAMATMKQVDERAAAATIGAALDLLARDPRIAAPRTGVIGWCFGGGWALETALTHPELDAAVIYYGRLVTDPAALRTIEARVLGIFGDRDQGIPVAEVQAFEAALAQAGVDATIRRYDADHAFANPSGPRYDEAAAADAWQQVTGFLAATLGQSR